MQANSIEEVIQKLENAKKTLFQRFNNNQMKANPDKYLFLFSPNREVSLTIESQIIKNSNFGKLFGIKLASKLNFNYHIHDICQKAGQKLNAISKITTYMNFAKTCLLVNTFFYSQFNYFQLVWICHNRTNNNKINCLRERCLCSIYSDKKLSFADLLQMDGSVSIHHRNLRTVAVELFKVLKGLSLVIFAEGFPVRQPSQYNMRNYSHFAMPRPKTVNHGLESLSCIGSKLWDRVPSHMKEIDSMNEFKHVIRTWKPDLYSCRLRKAYLQNF